MELFTAKDASSFGAHVAVHELGLAVKVTLVGIGQPRSLLYRIDPRGRVPALVLDDHSLLSENGTILPYLADLKPGTALFAPAGSDERAQIQAWIGYVDAEVAVRDAARRTEPAALKTALAPIEQHLAGRTWLVADQFTIADACLGLFAGRVRSFGEELAQFSALARYADRFDERFSVRAARMLEELELAA